MSFKNCRNALLMKIFLIIKVLYEKYKWQNNILGHKCIQLSHTTLPSGDVFIIPDLTGKIHHCDKLIIGCVAP